MSHERRVFIDSPPSLGESVTLSPSDSRHLTTVLRLRAGAVITVVERASGKEYEAIIFESNGVASAKILGELSTLWTPSPVRTVLFALCKGKANEFVAEKATELRVGRLIFWQAERSVVRLEAKEDRVARAERLTRIAEAAARQSGSQRIPEILVVEDLRASLSILKDDSLDGDRFFSCSLSPNATPFEILPPSTGRSHLVIGPEGDFSSEEERLQLENGFEFVTLGPSRLRSETAAVVAISMAELFHNFGRRR